VGQPVNVRLELTIADQGGAGEPVKRAVTILVADRGSASLRMVPRGRLGRLNVDARPTILSGGNVRVGLGLEYARPVGQENVETVSDLNQQLTVVLEPGKPLVISQAADPLTDRRISLEVRATVAR
jgi:hypothetical protein